MCAEFRLAFVVVYVPSIHIGHKLMSVTNTQERNLFGERIRYEALCARKNDDRHDTRRVLFGPPTVKIKIRGTTEDYAVNVFKKFVRRTPCQTFIKRRKESDVCQGSDGTTEILLFAFYHLGSCARLHY